MAVKQLHPGARWLFRLKAIFPILILIIWFASFAWRAVLSSMLPAFITIIIIAIAFIELYARLSYRFWNYEFTGDQLRIERGIIWKRYSNIPYQRIQNVDITRGVIARLCGFSSVNLQTAGFSAPTGHSYGMMAEGYIPAVPAEEAENIREFVIKKIGKKRYQGL